MATTGEFFRKLQSKNVLILGGTSGVGLAAAAALLEQGTNVIISSSQQIKLDSAIKSLKSAYPNAKGNISGFVCNLSGSEIEINLQNLAAQVVAHLSTRSGTEESKPKEVEDSEPELLDHFIYTAGDALPTVPIEQVTPSKFESALHVRVLGTFLAVKTFLPLLRTSSETSITLTSGSIHQKPIGGGWSMLSFIGAGLTGLTRQLAFDLAPIRVNCVAPGVVNTDLWSNMDETTRKTMFEAIEKTLPTGKVPTAEDLAESYVYLIRDRNTTGCVIDSNGGSFLI